MNSCYKVLKLDYIVTSPHLSSLHSVAHEAANYYIVQGQIKDNKHVAAA